MPSHSRRCLLLSSLLPLVSSLVLAQVSDVIRDASLAGLTGFSVSVGELSAQVQAEGLTADQLRDDIGLKLRAAAIGTVPESAWIDSAGSAELYLEANTLKYGGTQYSFSLQLNVIQKVLLPSKEGRQTLAATWSATVMGVAGARSVAGTIRGQAGTQVDRFIIGYRSANPLKEKR